MTKEHGLEAVILRLRSRRWANLAVANLRILIGFAFLPAGLKKLLGQPFTDAYKAGAFHDFLHAFHDTGGFYRFVGCMQLIAAALLMTQTFALVGAVLMLPILVAIGVLCYSTGVGIPTLTTVTLMAAGVVGLLLWDMQKWRALLTPDQVATTVSVQPKAAVFRPSLWATCGWAVLATYGLASALHGGVYRPRGVELDNPAFYLLPLITVYPVVTWMLDRAWFRRTKP